MHRDCSLGFMSPCPPTKRCSGTETKAHSWDGSISSCSHIYASKILGWGILDCNVSDQATRVQSNWPPNTLWVPLSKNSRLCFLTGVWCAVWPNLRPYNSKKLQFRSKHCVFLGYLNNKQVWYASFSLINMAYFAYCVNECFGPPSRHNPMGELASVQKSGTIDDYM